MTPDFFETIPGELHTRLHKRVWEHPGCVVDLGCYGWDWSKVFVGKKRVVGADPNEVETMCILESEDESQLFPGLVGAMGGNAYFHQDKTESSVLVRVANPEGSILIEQRSWKDFCNGFKIESVAVLKMNIEGSEWPLIMSMDAEDFDRIDQVAVSFHHFRWPAMAKATAACGAYIESLGFESIVTRVEYGWVLFLKK